MGKAVTSESVFVGVDLNDHVDSDVDSLGGVHGFFGIVQVNDGGLRMMDGTVEKGMHLMSTYFGEKKKMERFDL